MSRVSSAGENEMQMKYASTMFRPINALAYTPEFMNEHGPYIVLLY
jgi:hypothetical protein